MRLLLSLLVATASAQTVEIEAYPGCFLGPRRHTISLSLESPPLVTLYREDGTKQQPVRSGTIEQSKKSIQQLLELELTKPEIELLRNVDTVIGPPHYEIKLMLTDRTWEVCYPGFLVGQPPEKKKLWKYDAPTLAMIAKLEKIHAIITEISTEAAQ